MTVGGMRECCAMVHKSCARCTTFDDGYQSEGAFPSNLRVHVEGSAPSIHGPVKQVVAFYLMGCLSGKFHP